MSRLRNDLARLFIADGGVFTSVPNFEYYSFVTAGGLSQDNGDITEIQEPDPDNYGSFRVTERIRGDRGRLTVPMNARITMGELAVLRKMFDQECRTDVHIHFGQCGNPSDFNDFEMAWIVTGALPTSWSTDDVGAMESGDRAVVTESLDVSADTLIQVLNIMAYTPKATSTTATTGAVVGVAICDRKVCGGDRCQPSGGCDKIYAATSDGKVLYSLDGGGTWGSVTIPVSHLPANSVVIDLVCLADYVLILTSDSTAGDAALVWSTRDAIDAGATTGFDSTQGVFTTEATGLGGNGRVAYVGLDDGSIYKIGRNPGTDVTLVDDGSTVSSGAVNGIAVDEDGLVVAVANGGKVAFSDDGNTFSIAANDPTSENLNSVLIKSRETWIVGGAAAELWATSSQGSYGWTQIAFPGSSAGTGVVTDLAKSNDHVLWMAFDGTLLRSVDSGATWTVQPNSTATAKATVAAYGNVIKVVGCHYDANLVIAGGDDGDTNGLLLLGTE